MRVGADYVSVNECWTVAGAAVRDGLLSSRHSWRPDRCRPLLRRWKLGKFATNLRDIAAGGLDFDWNGDGVFVVFANEEHGQLAVGGGVHRFPEFALAGGAVAGGDVGDFVAVESYFFEFAVVALRIFARLRDDG